MLLCTDVLFRSPSLDQPSTDLLCTGVRTWEWLSTPGCLKKFKAWVAFGRPVSWRSNYCLEALCGLRKFMGAVPSENRGPPTAFEDILWKLRTVATSLTLECKLLSACGFFPARSLWSMFFWPPRSTFSSTKLFRCMFLITALFLLPFSWTSCLDARDFSPKKIRLFFLKLN
jgi:hypothetical protein